MVADHNSILSIFMASWLGGWYDDDDDDDTASLVLIVVNTTHDDLLSIPLGLVKAHTISCTVVQDN